MTIPDQRPIGSAFTAASSTADVLEGHALTGRVALVTGGYSGLGLATTRALAFAGARVLVPARRAGLARQVLGDVPGVEVLDDLDLGDLTSVARCAARIGELTDGIDLFIAAAGVMATPHRPVGPGWDYQLTVNHLGPFALTTRIFGLLAAHRARVVVYSSAGHHLSDIRWDDPHLRTDYDRWIAYGPLQNRWSAAGSMPKAVSSTRTSRPPTRAPQQVCGRLPRRRWRVSAGSTSRTVTSLRWHRPDGSMDDGGVKPYALDPGSAERLSQVSAALTATDLPE